MKYPITELRISHSSMQTLHSCPRKFEFSKLFNHRKWDESLAASVGSALHKAFQNYLETGDMEQATWALIESYPIHLNDNPMNDRSIETCYSVLCAMVNHPRLGEYELAYFEKDGKSVPAIEVPFEIHLTGLDFPVPVRYIGFIDAIFYDKVYDTYIVVDIKTTRQNLKDYSAAYQFSEQCLPYALVIEQLLGQSINSLKVMYYNCYIDMINPRIGLYTFDKDADDVQDWVRGLKVDLASVDTFAKLGWFPRHTGSCISFNKPCKNSDLCVQRDIDLIQELILLNHEPAPPEKEPDYLVSMELKVS